MKVTYDKDGVRYIERFLTRKEAGRLFDNYTNPKHEEYLLESLSGHWRNRPACWVGDKKLNQAEYAASGKLNDSLRDLIKKMRDYTGDAFDCIFMNYYRTGSDYCDWHSDPVYEEEVPWTPILALGAIRTLAVRDIVTKEVITEFAMKPGDVCMIHDDVQLKVEHSLLREPLGSFFHSKPTKPRLSLAFRKYYYG